MVSDAPAAVSLGALAASSATFSQGIMFGLFFGEVLTAAKALSSVSKLPSTAVGAGATARRRRGLAKAPVP